VLAFLLIVASWLKSNRWLDRGAWVFVVVGVAFQIAGIAMRCYLRDRPPISSLYETMIFISTAGAIVSIVAEILTRRGIALALAPILGGVLLGLAGMFEASKGEDTMPQLQAVLDTNFWLWIHVTCINLGYNGSALAWALGSAYVLGRA